MNILGISCFYHDSAACLVQNGKIVAAAQEERFTRIKQDSGFPKNAIRFCLEYAGLTVKDLDIVAFYDKPFIKFERILETYMAFAPDGLPSFLMAVPLWIKQKLWIPDLIRKEINYDGKIIFPEHHESHAAAAFYPSPYQQAAYLTMDGVGEWTTTSFGIGRDNRVTIDYELHFPHSLGLLYSAFTYYTGFKVNSGEYKVMGLAPYGEPKYVQTILDKLVDLKDDGSFRINMDYFNYGAGLTMTNKKFDALFGGPPRQPETLLTQKEMNLARSIQVVTEEIMMRCINHVHKQTGMDYLCLAGGVALNCVANGRILREGPFKDIWIQPAAGDAGGALGAALFAWYQVLANNRTASLTHDDQYASLLGPEFSNDEIADYIQKNNIPCEKLDEEQMLEKTAGLMTENHVIGWFQGRMEFGPRALGSRSIIGDARSGDMQARMNLKIKFRESFRPFAPTVLEEYVADYFELDRPSPYMLLVAQVKKEKCRPMTTAEEQLWGIDKLNIVRSEIPAITHVDYSARVQTVSKDYNPLYYRLIEKFRQKTGCPVIINTSFNVRGEPIVCTPADAYKCFMRTAMDYLVIGNYILDKTKQPEFKDDINWKEQYGLD
ncbi:MAG TPA: carbamoyltransferase [bacterium]|nr:carbamoyltransferase [bacterium]HPN42598.1 carbamoyltransferase [bacterium]